MLVDEISAKLAHLELLVNAGGENGQVAEAWQLATEISILLCAQADEGKARGTT